MPDISGLGNKTRNPSISVLDDNRKIMGSSGDVYAGSINYKDISDNLIKTVVFIEDKRFSEDYLDPEKRSIANAMKVIFKDGSSTDDVEVEYPIGHKRRRSEGIPLLEQKFLNNLNTCFDKDKSNSIYKLGTNQENLEKTTVHDFMAMLVKN